MRVYVSQIAQADVILLNKVDLTSEDQLEEVRQAVAEINPQASVLCTRQCDIDVALVLDALGEITRPNAEDHGGHHDHGHTDFDSLVLDAGADVGRAEVEAFFAGLPPGVLRAKGFMIIEGRPSLVQYAAGQLDITPAEKRRVQQMVFIGRGLDQAGIDRLFAFAGAAG